MASNYLAVSDGTIVELRDADTFEIVKVLDRLPKTGPSVRSIYFSQCGAKMAVLALESTSSAPNPVFVFDTVTTFAIAEIGGEDCIRVAMFNSDADHLLTRNYKGNINLWKLSNGQRLLTIKAISRNLIFPPVGFSVGSQRIIASADAADEPSGCIVPCTIMVFDVDNGDTVLSLDGHTKPVRSIAVNPVGDTFASSSNDQTVIVWDLSAGSLRRRLILPSIADTICYFPDGARLAVSQSTEISIVSMDSYEALYSVPSYSRGIWSLSISSDGSRVAWTDLNGKGRFVFDVQVNSMVFNAPSKNNIGGACCFSQHNVVVLM
jgi:WD40 repeat protein